MTTLKYRREIDGLRAIAVLPVILFHAGFQAFSGGYIGVDVFFVISGYLITSILLDEIENDSFSFIRFYERRARRILPALFFVILCCLPFAWMWLLPSQFADFAKSVVGVVFFSSNMVFWREDGYFAASADLKPLLHTWSLAVEEQYYLLFPPFLLLMWRFARKRVVWIILAIWIASLALSEWAWRHTPAAGFYLAPTRAWELLTGSICAIWLLRHEQRDNNALALLGLAMIIAAIFCFDEFTPMPSLYALLPVLGAALIILFGGSGSWAGTVLGRPVFVGIGLISYSAYLWHQPLFAFARIRSLWPPSQGLMTVLSLLSLLLAYLSWRFVERPFRKTGGGPLPGRRQVFFAAAATGGLLCLFGAVGFFGMGLPSRFEADTLNIEARTETNFGLHQECDSPFNESVKCRTSANPEFLLWGDSFAMHLTQGLVASEPSLALQQKTLSACPPILAAAPLDVKLGLQRSRDCIKANRRVIDYLYNNKSINFVVLSSPFSWIDSKYVMSDGSIRQLDIKDIAGYMKDTIASVRATGRRVLIFSPTPQNGNDIGQCLIKSTAFGLDSDQCNFSVPGKSAPPYINDKSFKLMALVASDVPIIKLDEMICNGRYCHTMVDGVFIYRDSGHLSKEGSAYLGQKYHFVQLVREQAR